jgi:copper chaperone CopZ
VLSGLDGVRSTCVNPAPRTTSLVVDPAHVDVNAVARAIADGAFGWRVPFSTAESGL